MTDDETQTGQNLESPPGRRVLFVEDDETLAGEVMEELMGRGFLPFHEETGPAGLQAALTDTFDVMILDRMLPLMDGLAVVERMRTHNVRTPVLVLSALSAVDDRVSGLKAGGDDYLTKPFAMDELVARIEALLRRPNDTRATVLRAGSLEMDLIDRIVRRGEREIELLPREFRLLEYLMRRPDQVLTRAMLLEDVWHYRFVPQTNLVDVHIGKLRRKVDAPGETPLIQSIRGAGFMLRVTD
ncbi:response regulator transcription factor [Brytella acorum]|uniref:Response regulator transcription factor n=1 Tax=Brytella acorum TaxID=2959299 RepID=A0AA35UFF0_9PROT|nr:response regulator transcription factor [Brytella acorum]MDF3624833.1 response regulator transcription factor [Brytella acorum]CAI9120136.1 response regulator transcription factor [Brytella acorum]